MVELVRENWIFLVLALLVGLIVAWWLFVAQRRTKVEIASTDENEGPARRNQALIDAAPASATPVVPPPTPEGLSGVGEAVAAAASVSPPPSDAKPADDLTRIKGVGPKLVEQLRTLGVTRFDQIAAWDDAEIDRIDAQLGRFAGRIRRDSWIEQARFLDAGDTAGYEAKFGKL
jgi:predicted flap endonuclease-1-like 5' DNA nuclease